MAQYIAEELNLSGVLAIEMFLTDSEELYVNELAPRPHNSGHYSIEACSFSQFDAHIRGISNWGIGLPQLLQSVVMVNLLGEHLEKLPVMHVKTHLASPLLWKSRIKSWQKNGPRHHYNTLLIRNVKGN